MGDNKDGSYLIGKQGKPGSNLQWSVGVDFPYGSGQNGKNIKTYNVSNPPAKVDNSFIRRNTTVKNAQRIDEEDGNSYYAYTLLRFSDIRDGKYKNDDIIFGFYFETDKLIFGEEAADESVRNSHRGSYTMLDYSVIYSHYARIYISRNAFNSDQNYGKAVIPINSVILSNFLEDIEPEPPVPDDQNMPHTPTVNDIPDYSQYTNQQRYSIVDYSPNGVFTTEEQAEQIWFDTLGRLIKNNNSNSLCICKPVIYDADNTITLKIAYSVSKDMSYSRLIQLLNITHDSFYAYNDVCLPYGVSFNHSINYEGSNTTIDHHQNETSVAIFEITDFNQLKKYEGNTNQKLFILSENNAYYLCQITHIGTYKKMYLTESQIHMRYTDYGINFVYISDSVINEFERSMPIVGKLLLPVDAIEYSGLIPKDPVTEDDTPVIDSGETTETNNTVDESGDQHTEPEKVDDDHKDDNDNKDEEVCENKDDKIEEECICIDENNEECISLNPDYEEVCVNPDYGKIEKKEEKKRDGRFYLILGLTTITILLGLNNAK